MSTNALDTFAREGTSAKPGNVWNAICIV